MRTRERHMPGWGGLPRARSFVLEPADEADLLERLATDPVSLLPRGMGRSYGDACTADRLLLARCLRSPLRLDEDSGLLEAGAGWSLGEVVERTLPRGWVPAVLPGTRHVTLGGAVSCDVHGKNHHVDGSFCRHVEALRVVAADGEPRWCSRSHEPDLFHACCGGLGLAGLILALRLRLAARDTVSFQRTTLACGTLDTALQNLREAPHSHTVAWVDAASPPPDLGRCLVFLGEPAPGHHRELPRPHRLIAPFRTPVNWVRPGLSRVFNRQVWRGGTRRHGRSDLQAMDSFFWPLDAVEGWNRFYGSTGFLQFQCLLPEALLAERGAAPLRWILERFLQAGGGTLAVLKTMGPAEEPAHPLAFAGPGATLAVDLPAHPEARQALREANRQVVDWGGRIYLAKDALLEPGEFRAMTPRLDEWLELRGRLDPQSRWQGDLSRRLGL